jgi:predicted ATPase
LFIEEIVQALLEQGVLKRNGARYVAQPITQLRIPTTVQAILASRVDRLAPAQKELLQTLAVLGDDFTLTLARRVTTIAEGRLREMLNGLEAGAFIRRRDHGELGEYSFKHALTQDVAYSSVLRARRTQLHERIAAVIEAEFGDRLDDHLRELAHHYGRSSNHSKAVEYLHRAGRQAEQRSAYSEAAAYQERALELLKFLPDGTDVARRELSVQIALAGNLRAIKGFAADEVG